MKKIKWSFLFTILFFQLNALGVVDMKSGNYSDTWIDAEASRSPEVSRTYNSRSIFVGIFGFGWCSPFETKLNFYKEGSNEYVTVKECGDGEKTTYHPSGFNNAQNKNLIDSLLKKVKDLNKHLLASNKGIVPKIKNDSEFQEMLYSKIGWDKKPLPEGKLFVETGTLEKITRKKNTIYRTQEGLIVDEFSLSGKLKKHWFNKNKYFKISYNKTGNIDQVCNELKICLFFSYEKKARTFFVKSIKSSFDNKEVISYTYSGEDLKCVSRRFSKDKASQETCYAYDDRHNLVKANLPNGKSFSLTYDLDKDWAASYTNKNGCVEKYTFTPNPENPVDHYWSEVKKTCDGRVVNKSKFEFIHKDGPKGKYLHTLSSDENGVKSKTEFHPTNGQVTKKTGPKKSVAYVYNKKGLIAQKIINGRIFWKYSYDNKCVRVKKSNFKQIALPSKSISDSWESRYRYNVNCNVILAQKSDGSKYRIKLSKGLVSEITDVTNPKSPLLISFKYDEHFKRASEIKVENLGSLELTYRKGRVSSVFSPEGSFVQARIARLLKGVFEVLEPVEASI